MRKFNPRLRAAGEAAPSPTNGQRANAAAKALKAWKASADSDTEDVGDLIGDLCHLAHKQHLDPEDVVHTALTHWREESRNE